MTLTKPAPRQVICDRCDAREDVVYSDNKCGVWAFPAGWGMTYYDNEAYHLCPECKARLERKRRRLYSSFLGV